MELLAPSETSLFGEWIIVDGKAQEDPVARRISWLIENHLIKVGVKNDGWDTIFRDPSDGRVWRLNYPRSDMHGGGPPQLTCIPLEQQAVR